MRKNSHFLPKGFLLGAALCCVSTTSAGAAVSYSAEASMPQTPLYGSISAGDAGFVTGIALINSPGDDLQKYDTGSETPVVPLGATYGDGSYYRIYRTTGRYATNKFEIVNPLTWKTTLAPSSFSGFVGSTPLGMAYDSETGNVFYATCSSPWAINTVTTKTAPPSASATKYCALPEQWVALAMDTDNRTLWGITLSGTLKKLDKLTKEITVVGETGLVSAAATSAAIDPATGNLYFASWPSDKASGLYYIDKATAAATLVKSFSKHEHIQGMFFMPPIVVAAPSKPGLPSCSFEGVSTTGTVTFYMPNINMGGTTLEGDQKWTVTCAGKTLATGQAAPGAQVKADVTVETPGQCWFGVYASNAAGDGAKAFCGSFVGPDAPLAVTGIKLTYADGNASMTWTAPTAGINGKSLDTDNLTYDVYRLPGREKVGTALKECAFSETLAEPAQLTVYSYEIVPRHYQMEGTPASSPTIVLGTVKPPYYEDFEDFVYIPQWTILDLNNDGHTWSTTFNHYAYLSPISRTWDTENHEDMMISPMIDIKAGFAYDIEFEGMTPKATVDAPHVVSLLYGTAPTKEAMTGVLIDKMQVTEQPVDDKGTAVAKVFKARLMLDHDAKVCLGVLITNGRGPNGFELHSFRVQAPKLLESPQPVANLKAVPDFEYKDECTLTFTTPALSAENTPLTGLTKIEVYRNGELAGVIDSVETGKDYTYLDTVAAHGQNNYKVIAYNDGGASDPAETVAYTGIQLPAGVPSVTLHETSPDGTIHVEWTAPDKDIHGQPLNLKYVDYEVKGVDSRLELYTLLTDIKDLKADIKLQQPGKQQRYTYVYVYAKNAAGMSPTPSTSNYVIVGAPLDLPFSESFPSATCDNHWTTNPLAGTNKWTTFPGKSQDIEDAGGDAIVESFSGNPGDRAELQSGKIAITGKKPHLSFYAMNNGPASKNAIEAWVILEDGTSEMLCREIPAGSKSEWTRYSASLEKYIGQNIKLNFVGEIIEGRGVLIDEIRIDSHYAKDLRIEQFDIVRSVLPGMEIPVKATYANHGDEPASGYRVVLLVDDVEVGTASGETIKPGEEATVSFLTSLPETDATVNHKGELRIEWDADEMPENNTRECRIVNKVTANPVPTGLVASESGNAVMLTWKAPAAPTGKPEAVTESFEEYDAWETDYMGYWTLYDEDQLPTTTMDIYYFPLDGKPKSWFIFNGSEKIFAANYRARTGDKCISNMASWDLIGGNRNSDWIISPALWGHEQTIDFYVRQSGPLYREDFEVYYSTGSDSISDFKLLATEKTDSYEWTKYEYTLPEGTNYFAIRCKSLNQFMLHIDDITYIPDNGSSPNLELKEYTVWRDGEKAGTADGTATSYIDPINDGEEHHYMLTAVYNRGFSAPSNTASIVTSGVDAIYGTSARVSATKGAVTVNGYCDTVAIYTADGRLVSTLSCNGSLTIPVAPGIYIVQLAGEQPVKIAVK